MCCGRSLTEPLFAQGGLHGNPANPQMPPVFGQVIGSPRRGDRTRQFWQQSRHPEGIWSRSFWMSKLDYLHDNPRRKGLVRDGMAWRFSSAAFWLLEPQGESDVILTALDW